MNDETLLLETENDGAEVRCSGVVVRASDLQSTDRGFESRCCRATTVGKLFTYALLFTKRYNLAAV